MRPLPRLHAVTDAAVLAREDFAIRAGALAAVGSSLALHARDRTAGGKRLAEVTSRLLALARPAEASVFVNARADVAAALGVQGLQLGQEDPAPGDARAAFESSWRGWIGMSVHSLAQVAAAVQAGADYLLLGSIYPTASHPGVAPLGPELVAQAARSGLPVIAIGGVTPERVAELRQAGAYGVAAIRALWQANHPYNAAVALLAPWAEDA